VGGDVNKLYVTAEGEADEHEVESAEVQVLWSRMIAPFWDVQAGVRHDFEPESLNHAVLGVQGLAPYLFEVDAAAFLSEDGDLSARAEVEYELLFTQRLILSPDVEVNAYASDIPELDVASGIATVEANLRLRYEVTRKFAPYVEVTYERALGETADLRRAAGDDVDATIVRAGLRLIF
jgi:copper resistance protein B